MEQLIKKSNFPWLLTNVLDLDTKEPLMNLNRKVIVNINGIKVGIFGLAEKDWVTSLSAIPFDEVIYEPYVEISRKMARELKTKDVNSNNNESFYRQKKNSNSIFFVLFLVKKCDVVIG